MKLIIEYEAAASEEIEYRDGARTPKYEHHGSFVGYKPNLAAWALGPYERYLKIDVYMRLYGPNVVTIERELCTVKTYDEGTLAESCAWRVTRHKTSHYLTNAQLGAAWPEIEQRKREGAALQVHPLPQIVDSPFVVATYIGV